MFKDALRLTKILHTLLKARIDKELDEFDKPKLISFLLLISPWQIYSAREPSGERLRVASVSYTHLTLPTNREV